MSSINARRPAARRQKSERGVALLMVVMLVTLVTAVVSDFQYSSQVDVELAYHARDDLQAEQNALSALRFRALLLKQARTLQTLVKAISGGVGQPPPIASIMELIPVECGLLSALMHSDGDEPGDFFEGDCWSTSESEHAKIAINLLSTPQSSQSVGLMLLGLLRNPSLQHHFEQDDRSGQHADSPLLLVQGIADWIDADHAGQGNLGDEDRFYQSMDPPYRSKNAPLDSVAELQLVHGIGDALYDVLKDRVSVYSSSQQIELATASMPTVLGNLAGAIGSLEALEAYYGAAPALEARLTMLRSLGPMVPLTLSMLKLALTDVGLLSLVDLTKLSSIFTDGSSSTWYTVRAEGQVGRASRKLRMVFQADEGIFYYARVE
jgi:general secretion pathway protein K